MIFVQVKRGGEASHGEGVEIECVCRGIDFLYVYPDGVKSEHVLLVHVRER